MARRTCPRILGRRSSSPPVMYPPVSIRRNRRPSYSTGWATRSRVTPGWSKVMARRFPVIRLKSVDFPVFGRPTRATVYSPRLISQAPQHGFAARPLPLDLDEQLQVYPRPRLFLQFPARLGADFLQEGTALPDDDPFLGLALHQDVRPDPHEVPLRLLPVLLDLDRDAVRDLLLEEREQLLPDHLLGDEAHREVRQVLLRVECGPLGQAGEQGGHEGVHPVTARRGEQEGVCVESVCRKFRAPRRRGSRPHPVHLVHHEDPGDRQAFEDSPHDGALSLPVDGPVVHYVGDDVGLLADPLRGPHHVRVEGPVRPVDPGAVEENDLPPRLREDPRDPVPRGLGPGSDDGDLRPKNTVQKRGFPHVRAPQQGDEPRFPAHLRIPPLSRRGATGSPRRLPSPPPFSNGPIPSRAVARRPTPPPGTS